MKIAETMHREDGVREAPVVENGRLVGEVTRGDLIQLS
jgi:CBS domain-containing protein